MEAEELIKKYALNEEQIELFNELKSVAPENLSDEYIIWCMITKKKKEKVIKSMNTFSGIIEKYNWGNIEIQKIHLEHMIQGYFFVDPNIRGVNGEVVLFAKIDQYFEAKKVPEKIVMEAHIHFMDCLNRYSVDSINNGITVVADLRNFSIWKIPWDVQKVMTPMAQKVPLRVKNILAFYPPTWFSVAMAIVRPFLSAKMAKRVLVVKSIEDLKKYVTGVPVEMGGTCERNPFRALRDVYCRTDREKRLLKEIAVSEMKEMLSLSNSRIEEKKKKNEKDILRRNRSLIDMEEMKKVVRDTNLDEETQKSILDEIRKKKEEFQLEEIKKNEKKMKKFNKKKMKEMKKKEKKEKKMMKKKKLKEIIEENTPQTI